MPFGALVELKCWWASSVVAGMSFWGSGVQGWGKALPIQSQSVMLCFECFPSFTVLQPGSSRDFGTLLGDFWHCCWRRMPETHKSCSGPSSVVQRFPSNNSIRSSTSEPFPPILKL
eukprot:1158493-Pelagomonas_calceolata.AAC.3